MIASDRERRSQASAGQAIQAVGKIHGVRAAHDHQDRQRNKPESQVDGLRVNRQRQQQAAGHAALNLVQREALPAAATTI